MYFGKFASENHVLFYSPVPTFTYHNSAGICSRREIAPLQLYFKSSAWYAVGHCMQADAIRIFKMSRMQNVILTDDPIPENLAIPSFPDGDASIPLTAVTLRLVPEMAYRVYDEFTEEEYTQEPDGHFLVTYRAPENDWLYGYLLSFHPGGEVLAPAHIRKRIYELLKSSLSHYQHTEAE